MTFWADWSWIIYGVRTNTRFTVYIDIRLCSYKKWNFCWKLKVTPYWWWSVMGRSYASFWWHTKLFSVYNWCLFTLIAGNWKPRLAVYFSHSMFNHVLLVIMRKPGKQLSFLARKGLFYHVLSVAVLIPYYYVGLGKPVGTTVSCKAGQDDE